MNDNQLKKLEKLAEFADDKDLATLEHFISIGEKLDEVKDTLNDTTKDIKDTISAIEIPEPKDEQANFDAILAKLDEPLEIELVIQ